MKILFQDYTFNAATKQITFNTTESIKLENILVITNVTDNIIIYNFRNNKHNIIIFYHYYNNYYSH